LEFVGSKEKGTVQAVLKTEGLPEAVLESLVLEPLTEPGKPR
jgi:hypothetical protein